MASTPNGRKRKKEDGDTEVCWGMGGLGERGGGGERSTDGGI